MVSLNKPDWSGQRSGRLSTQGEVPSLHIVETDLCDCSKCEQLGRIISPTGNLRSRSPLFTKHLGETTLGFMT